MELLRFHDWCTSDPILMHAYESGIAQLLNPGDIVLDLGAGTGILGLCALRAGASHVHAIECSPIANVISRLAQTTDMADRISVHHQLSFDVDIADRADLMVASMLDSVGINNNILGIIRDARQRLLKPGATVIPSAIQVSFSPVEIPKWYAANIDCWNRRRLDFDFSSLRTIAVNHLHATLISKDSLLSQPVSFSALDRTSNTSLAAATFSASGEASFVIERAGLFHGFAAWYDATIAEGVSCGNSPLDPNRLSWTQGIFAVEEPVPVDRGDRVEATLVAVTIGRDMTWKWTARVIDPAGLVKALFRHSTFEGSLVNRKDMVRHSSAFTPVLSERGKAQLMALQLFDGVRSVGEIARALRFEFANLFDSELIAEAFVGVVLAQPNLIETGAR